MRRTYGRGRIVTSARSRAPGRVVSPDCWEAAGARRRFCIFRRARDGLGVSMSTITRAPAEHAAHARRRDRFTRMWRSGAVRAHTGPVHVSMNDYLVEGPRDTLRVALAGMRFWLRWPRTEGALGCWFAGARAGQRSVSVSVWRAPEDLRRFVRSSAHLKVMREFRDTG